MKALWKSFKITLAFCVLLAAGYVLILWTVARIAGPGNGNAETVAANGRVAGAANVGQTFTRNIYFWGRPSAVAYDGSGSGGSNKGTTNPAYLTEVDARIDTFLIRHPYLTRSEVPSELVTASGSGLDPDISPNAAFVQAERVAAARGVAVERIDSLIREQTEGPLLGLFGPAKVNVLQLNIALDRLTPVSDATRPTDPAAASL